MKIKGDKVVIDKEELLVSFLSLGLAINILVDNTELSQEKWIEMLGDEAHKQLVNIKKNSPQKIDKILNEIAKQLNA